MQCFLKKTKPLICVSDGMGVSKNGFYYVKGLGKTTDLSASNMK